MDAVHARSDEHLIEQVFGTERKPDVAVVKEHLNQTNELIDGEGPCRRADETHLEKTENHREPDLTEMETEGGGNIQVRVGMMDIVNRVHLEYWRSGSDANGKLGLRHH